MISVIFSVCNVGLYYLFVGLNSISSQTFVDFKIMCIDDASSDSSLDILNYFSKKDSQINVIPNKRNIGLIYTRNCGFEVSDSKYISFPGCDYFLSHDIFEILVKKVENDSLEVVMFKNSVLYDNKIDFGMELYYDMKFKDRFENRIFNDGGYDKNKLFVMSNNLLFKAKFHKIDDKLNVGVYGIVQKIFTVFIKWYEIYRGIKEYAYPIIFGLFQFDNLRCSND